MGNQSSKHHHQINSGKPKKFVHWKSAERPSPPGRPILIPLSDQQPDVITLKWERPQSDGGSQIIGFIIEQRRMGSSHWVRATPALVPFTEVAISGLEPGWRYQFRAIAENVVGKSDPSELSDPLTVTLQRNAITVPRFMKELIDTTVLENERVEMKVEVLGQPPPEINWFKDGFEIFSSRRTKIINDNESSILIIHQCAFTDEGEIKCTATNRAGHVATKANLTVVAPPKIRLARQYEDGLIVEAGEILRLKIALAGQPPPTLIWSHEGEIINNGGRYELITTDKNSSLKIDSVKRSDRGEYTLRASNNLGEDVASFLVTVTSKPNPPGKVQLTMSFGRSATLMWTAPDDDGGCKIGNYIIEYFRVGWNVWLKAATTRQLSTTLHDLIEGSEYKFRVKAENPYGVSDPSEVSDILFIPDPRRGITKPTTENTNENKPPLPPKRRTLSPIKNLLGVGKKTSRSPSPNNQALNVQLIPEIFENEELRREMSYGTPNNVLNPKEHKRSVSFKDDLENLESFETQKLVQKPNKVSEGTQSLGLQKTASLKQSEKQVTTKENDNLKLNLMQRFQSKTNRSPSPAKRKMSLPGELERIPISTEEDNKNSIQKPVERRDSLIVEKVQQFFRRSPSPGRKQIENSDEKTASLERFTTDQPQRKDSLIIEKVQNFFRRSPSPSRKVITTDSSSLPSDINVIENESLKLSSKKSQMHKVQNEENLRSITQAQNSSSINLKVNSPENQKFNDMKSNNQNNTTQINQQPLKPNPTIEISAPKELSQISDKNETHISSEFMLVLHPPIKRSKEIEKQESFDLELEEALSPPPISFSVPDFTSEQLDLQMPPLRRSVSSTELLYERAMARFYEAVELEETEKIKHNKLSGDYAIRKRLGSFGKEERLSIERRQSFQRRLSEEVVKGLQNISNNQLDTVRANLDLSNEEEYQKTDKMKNEIEKEFSKKDDAEYNSDYTESTATSSNDSIEKFKSELLARTRTFSGELETYHPRRMDEGNLSPYRSPTPDQSAVILTKPLPPPDPDFVPKPILKRSSAENVLKEDFVKPISEEDKPKESGFSFTNIFKKDKDKSTSDLQKKKDDSKKNEEIAKTDEINNKKQIEISIQKTETISTLNTSQKSSNPKTKLVSRRASEEETKVVVDYYSDIVKELGGSRRQKIPIYMRGGDYSKSDDEMDTEIQDKQKKDEKSEEELIARALEKPRMSIVERLQSAHVQTKSKHAMEKPLKDHETKIENRDEKIETELEIEERGRQSERRPLILTDKKVEKEPSTTMKPRDDSTSRLTKVKTTDGGNVVSPVQRRVASRTRNRSESKSPSSLNRRLIKKEIISTNETKNEEEHRPITPESRPKTPEELLDEAQETVRSTISYITDVGLFIVACWVYIFKDVRLVLPILALLVYRQLGEALSNRIPDWMKRKKK